VSVAGRFIVTSRRPVLATPDEFSKMIAADTARLSKVIRDAGIKLQ
jgi:tripartite-type tricarboxylate transporter receptor subunit TctC